MASGDARPFPKKNVAYRVTFPIFDNDGDLVSGAASLDSEISKDGGTFVDVAAEATEIATTSGMYFLDLTATEMNADTVAIIVKTTTTDAKTTPIVLYPEEAGDIRVDVTRWQGVAPNTLLSGRVDVNAQAGLAPLGTAMRGTDSAALASVCTEARLAELAAANLPTDVAAVKTDTAAILVDTGTTLDAAIADIPTVAEFNARTLAAAGYFDPAADTVANVTTVAALTGHTAQTGDSFARLGAPAGASVSADIAAIPTVTEGRSLVTGTADSGTTTTLVDAARTEADTDYWKGCWLLITSGTAVNQVRLITGFNATTDTITFAPALTQAITTNTYEILAAGAISSVRGDVTGNVNGNVGGNVTGSVGSLGTTAKIDVNAECDTALTDYDAPTKVEMDTAHALLATQVAIDDVPTVAEFNARTVTSATYGTVANQTTILNRIGDFAGSGLNTIKGWLQALFRKDGGVSGANLPSEINEVENTIAGTYNATTDSQEAIRDTAPLGTAMRGTDSAALASVCTEARLAELDGTNVPTDLDTLITRLTAARAANLDEITAARLAELGATNIPADIDTLLARLTAARATLLDNLDVAVSSVGSPTLRSGTAQAGASSTITLDASASASNNFYNNAVIQLTGGLNPNQARIITGYDGTTKVATVSPTWAAVPDNTTTFSIWPPGYDATAVLTEAYAADGAQMTLAQALYEIAQTLSEFAISGTTVTVKKRDGATTALTFTLDDASNPTSRTRAT